MPDNPNAIVRTHRGSFSREKLPVVDNIVQVVNMELSRQGASEVPGCSYEIVPYTLPMHLPRIAVTRHLKADSWSLVQKVDFAVVFDAADTTMSLIASSEAEDLNGETYETTNRYVLKSELTPQIGALCIIGLEGVVNTN